MVVISNHTKYKEWTNIETAEICEMYFGLGLSIKEIAEQLNTTNCTIGRQLDKYFKKPFKTVILQSKINNDKK